MTFIGDVVPLHFEVTVNDVDTDPGTFVLHFIHPDGSTDTETPPHDGTGTFDYNWDTTSALPGRHSWIALTTGTGQAVASGVIDLIDPFSDAPQLTTVAPWTDAAAVRKRPGCADLEQSQLDDAARAATDVLYALSGRQFAGRHVTTVRPTATRHRPLRPTWGVCAFAYGSGYGGIALDAWLGHTCRCAPPTVELGAYPVTAILEVKIDGTTIPADEYRVDDHRSLVRVRPTADATPTARAGWPTCFPGGTRVLTERGLVPIEAVQVGDRVLTHRNRWQRVTWAGKTGDRETIVLTGRGGQLRCTPDHRLFTAEVGPRETLPNGRKGKQKLGAPEWTAAGAAIGQVWATPRDVEALPILLPAGWTIDNLPRNFWWVIGRWLGDGWTARAARDGEKASYRVAICSGHHEADALEQELALTGWTWHRSDAGRGARFRLSNPALWTWLREEFGVGATEKRIPSWVLGAPEDVRRPFLAGYVSADGWTAEPTDERRRSFVSVHTVSPDLALGTRLLATTLGYSPMIYRSPSGAWARHQAYRIDWPVPTPGIRPVAHWWDDGEHVWGRIRSAAVNEAVVPVYDIEVENDHSFIAEGIVVHNCQRLDLPDTEPGTFSVRFAFGTPPPPSGVQAAASLAAELALAWDNADSSTRLPARVQTIVRQGESVTLIDPQDVLDKGRTGIPEVDLFLKAVNPAGLIGRSSAWSPDMGRARRPG